MDWIKLIDESWPTFHDKAFDNCGAEVVHYVDEFAPFSTNVCDYSPTSVTGIDWAVSTEQVKAIKTCDPVFGRGVKPDLLKNECRSIFVTPILDENPEVIYFSRWRANIAGNDDRN